ncbi:glycoside hydrolase family 89 protein [Boletus edulis BED1]|uniref:Glycoside hydrolase family 89 protein n=1 Tax=Boletus edulis BED1 TaxID=1328754 RepID=A0AAD4C8M7_BOLED|nr:glycoside hydrolase family 89 protein [Boletus edulis BED1]
MRVPGGTGFVVLALGAAAAAHVSERGATQTGSLDGLYSLVKRRIPSHSDSFQFDLVPDDCALDTFTLSDVDSHSQGNAQINIQCSSVSACARGLYTYLTEYGGVDIWWTGSRLDDLPDKLPSIGAPVTHSSLVKYRYFFNTVTFSYTTTFYTFQDWELLLDWMALRGVNLPLAWVGYEYILVQVFREAGLSDSDIYNFFSGPPFQAFNRFGNIQGSWGGELSTQWVEDQFQLQKQLIPRMVELGMTPVMPSFTGFVPPALSALHPNAAIIIGGQWENFPSAYTNVSFLEPFDPLFSTLQKSFISKQAAAYGDVSHIYTLDQYNENIPSSNNASYLQSIASNTFASLRAADPDAVWMMQGWMFFSSQAFWTADLVQAYLGGVPGNDSLIILDLYSEAQPQWERLDAYYGKNWIWCQLHDYGGNMGFEGNLINITEAPLNALAATGSSMVGMGLTPEGLEGNEIVYDILLDQAWSSTPIDQTSYVSSWVSRRYNVDNLPQAAVDAWQLLASTVYNNQNPSAQATVKSILELAPALTGLVNRTGHHPTLLFYDTNTTIVPALQMLINATQESQELRAIPEFQYDLVDVTRQLLANRFIDTYENLVHVYNSSSTDVTAVELAARPLLKLIQDLDKLLSMNSHFLLSNWLDAARSWSHGNETYAAYLEYTAQNQITLWGPTGQINDYASKQWSGLVGGYYAARWQAFVTYLVESKQNSSYNATTVAKMMLSIGEEWDKRDPGGSGGTTGDPLEIVRALAANYTGAGA